MRASWFTLLTALLAMPTPAGATAVAERSIEEMAAGVPVVIRGVVQSTRAAWDGPRIWTFTEVRVLERIKGPVPSVVTVRQPGGEVGAIGQKVEGAAQFAAGEEVVLFLETPKGGPPSFVVSGMAAGKVRLEKTKAGETRAVRHLDGIAFYRPGAGGTDTLVRPAGREDLGKAEDFLKRVRLAVVERGGAK